MPRIRSLKPEFWQDEKLSLLDPLTRLVFLGLISLADDAGRVLDNVKLLDGQLFPNTDDTSREALDTLARLSRISRYRVASGQQVIQIVGWSKHQKVDNPSKYVLPGPDEAVVVQPVDKPEVTPPIARSSRQSRESVDRVSRSDLGSRILDLGPGTMDQVSDDGASSGSRKRRSSEPRASAARRPAATFPHFPVPECDFLHGAWIELVGAVRYPEFRAALGPVYTPDRTWDAWDAYAALIAFSEVRDKVEAWRAAQMTVRTFAQDFPRWRLAGRVHERPDHLPEPLARALAARNGHVGNGVPPEVAHAG